MIYSDKTLLITGGTGSFGNAVLKRFIASDFKEIRIFSRDEKKQDDMRKKFNNDRLKFYIGDVRDYPQAAYGHPCVPTRHCKLCPSTYRAPRIAGRIT